MTNPKTDSAPDKAGMGCCFSGRTLKHDEVTPVSSTPLSMANNDPLQHARNGSITTLTVEVAEPEQILSGSGVSASATTTTVNNSSTPPAEVKKAEEEFPVPDDMMTVEKVADGEGRYITLGKMFGCWTAPMAWLPEQVMRAQHFTFHDSDVILTGYAKSGSHWLWEMLQMLMKGRAEHSRLPKERLMLSFTSQQFFDTLQPPRVFNCHSPFHGLPAALRDGHNRCRMVHVLRNPKDVAVSYYHHLTAQRDFQYEGSFSGYLQLFLDGKVPGGSWFDYVLGWEETIKNNPNLPILVLHYEDMKEDTVSALSKLNAFLGLQRDDSLLREIAAQCTINKMKAVEEELKDQVPSHINTSKTGKSFIYRKGEVGDWKNWLSVADDERFQDIIDSRLRHSSLRFRYQLGPPAEERSSSQL